MFTFVELSAFERACPAYLDDEEYADNVPAHILKQLLEVFRDG